MLAEYSGQMKRIRCDWLLEWDLLSMEATLIVASSFDCVPSGGSTTSLENTVGQLLVALSAPVGQTRAKFLHLSFEAEQFLSRHPTVCFRKFHQRRHYSEKFR